MGQVFDNLPTQPEVGIVLAPMQSFLAAVGAWSQGCGSITSSDPNPIDPKPQALNPKGAQNRTDNHYPQASKQ